MSHVVSDSLYRNSSFLILNSVLVAALGFLFWTIAARHFPASAVGTTTTVISAITYAAMVGTLGLPNTVIRFLAQDSDPVRFLATVGAVTACAGAVVGLVWCAIPGHLGIPLSSVAGDWSMTPIIVAAVALGSVGAVAEAAIIALRTSKWVVVEIGAGSLVKLLGLPLAVGLGAAGLFGLFFASLLTSAIVSIGLLVREIGGPRRRWLRGVDLTAIGHVRSFAAANHLAALVSLLPGTVVRVVVLSQLGARDAAFLAMPLMIVALLKVIPAMASQSLFAEAAADEGSLVPQTRRTLRGIYSSLIPAVVAVLVFARPLLSIFGSDYAAAGTLCLQLLALSALPGGFNYVADTVLNARRLVGDYVFVNIVGSACAIGFPIAFVGHGLTGIGFGWLLGQLGYSAIAAATLLRRRSTASNRPGREEPGSP
jgi:O-antigen/teichoic acid export membrane protein